MIDDDPYRLYAIIRTDIEMDRGKIAAQMGHAYLEAYLLALEKRPETIPLYKKDQTIKIAMRAKKVQHLEDAYQKAFDAGIPSVLITDLGLYGLPEDMLGKPTVTALGLGPAKRNEVKDILKRFQLLK